MKIVFRKGWVSALLLIVAFLARTPASMMTASAAIEPTIIHTGSQSVRTTIIPITITACEMEKQALENYAADIAKLQTQEQQLKQQLQSSVGPLNQVYKAIVSDAATLQDIINRMTPYGNNIETNSGQCIPCYNVGFNLVYVANDLQKQHDDLQQQAQVIARYLTGIVLIGGISTEQEIRNSINDLNKVNQALGTDIAAINKDATGIGEIYGYVLNNQLDTSGVVLGTIGAFDHEVRQQNDDLTQQSQQISNAIAQLTNQLSVPGEIQSVESKIGSLQDSYNQMKAKAAKDCT